MSGHLHLNLSMLPKVSQWLTLPTGPGSELLVLPGKSCQITVTARPSY